MNTAVLKNESLEVRIAKPGEVYRGARFDWTGFITDIWFQKHSFCVPEQYVEGKGTGGSGFCNEFGIDLPLGYEGINVGGKFPKIGVGLVTKLSDEPYKFFAPAPVSGLDIIEEFWTDNKYKVVSEINDGNGLSMSLTKIISLEDSVLSIYYFLENQGSKKLITNEYNHNFIGINNDLVGPNYELNIPSLKGINSKVGEYSYKDTNITWENKPEGDFYGIVENGPNLASFNWELRHKQSKVGVREISTFPVSKIAFWGYTHVVCPEVFINIEIEPKASLSWKRCYEFFEFDELDK
jgi:hypothetical protein